MSCAKTKVSTEVIGGNMTPWDEMKRKEEQKVFSFSFNMKTKQFALSTSHFTLLKSSYIHMKEHVTGL